MRELQESPARRSLLYRRHELDRRIDWNRLYPDNDELREARELGFQGRSTLDLGTWLEDDYKPT